MSALLSRFQISGELMQFLWAQRLFWMMPLMVVLLVVALLIGLASASALAPFIYPLI